MWSVDPGEELVCGVIGDIGDGLFLPGFPAELLCGMIAKAAVSDNHQRTEPAEHLEDVARLLEAQGHPFRRDDTLAILVGRV